MTTSISWQWLVGHQVAVLVVLAVAGAFTRPWPVHQALVEWLVLATSLPVAVAAVVSAVRTTGRHRPHGSDRLDAPAGRSRGAAARLRSFVSRTWFLPVSWGLPDAFAALVIPLVLQLAGRDRWAEVASIGAVPGVLAAAVWIVVVLLGGMAVGAAAAVVTVAKGVGPASWRRGGEFSRAASTGGGLVLLGLLVALSALFVMDAPPERRGVALVLVRVGVAGPPQAAATILVRAGASTMVMGAVVWTVWSWLARRRAERAELLTGRPSAADSSGPTGR